MLAACARSGATFGLDAGGDGGTGSFGDGAPGDAPGSADGGTSKDGSGSTLDGAAPSSDGSTGDDGEPTEASSSGEGGPTSPGGVTCAGAPCYSGQSCVSGACTFAGCTGAQVPGDYATVQSAVTALQGIGGTICLGAQTFAETVLISGSKALTLQGVSTTQSTLNGVQYDATGGLTLKGLALQQVSISSATGTVLIQACKIDSASTNNYAVSVYAPDEALSVTLDGVDLDGNNQPAVYAYVENDESTALTLTIQNSYLHDSSTGVTFVNDEGNGAVSPATLTIVNDTFENDGTALLLTPEYSGVSVSYYNDLFYKNPLAINLGSNVTAAFGNNALFGNTTNYAGMAVDGTAYVKSDPMLDTSVTPPAPTSGSPILGAADPAHAPTHDFWGNPRGSHPDIGAVQVSQ